MWKLEPNDSRSYDCPLGRKVGATIWGRELWIQGRRKKCWRKKGGGNHFYPWIFLLLLLPGKFKSNVLFDRHFWVTSLTPKEGSEVDGAQRNGKLVRSWYFTSAKVSPTRDSSFLLHNQIHDYLSSSTHKGRAFLVKQHCKFQYLLCSYWHPIRYLLLEMH